MQTEKHDSNRRRRQPASRGNQRSKPVRLIVMSLLLLMGLLGGMMPLAQAFSPLATTPTPLPTKSFEGDVYLPLIMGDGTPQPSNNKAPLTYAVTAQVGLNQRVQIDLSLEAASDPDNDPLTFTLNQLPAHGTATLMTNTVTYTPASNFTGDDSLSYHVDDGQGHQVEGQVKLSVVGQGTPPIASDRMITVNTQKTTTIDLSTLVDNPTGQPLTYELAQDGDYGLATVEASTLTYQNTLVPTTTELFTDTVIYGVGYGNQQQRFGQLVIQVVSVEALRANQRVIPLYQNKPATIDLATLVVNPAGGSLQFELDTTEPISGEASLAGSQVSFNPLQDYIGLVGVNYMVTNRFNEQATGLILFDVRPPVVPVPQVETNRPVLLLIEPAQILFTKAGERQTLTLRAYNSRGGIVPLVGNIDWLTVHQDSAQALTITPNPANPAEVTVTAQNSVGYAQLQAKWGALTSRSAVVSMAKLQPGVVVVPDKAVVGPVTTAYPAEFEALATRSQRLAWLATKGADYRLPTQFRAVIGDAQVAGLLKPDTLVTTAGQKPIYGKITQAKTVANGTEIIYQTVPITDVVLEARFKGEFTAADLLSDEDKSVLILDPLNPIENQKRLRQARSGPSHVRSSQALGASHHLVRHYPCAGGKIALSRSDKYGAFKVGRRASAAFGCGVTVQLASTFRIFVESEKTPTGFHFAGSIDGSHQLRSQARFNLSGKAGAKIAPKTNLSLPIPGAYFAGVGASLDMGIAANVQAKGKMNFKAEHALDFCTHADWGTFQAPIPPSNCDPSVRQPAYSMKGRGEVELSLDSELGVKVGIGQVLVRYVEDKDLPKTVKNFIKKGSAGVVAKVAYPRFFVTYESDTAETGSLAYGEGSYGQEGTFNLVAHAFGFKKNVLQKNFGAFQYPAGSGSSVSSETDNGENNIPENICKKDGATHFENKNIIVDCKQVVKPCANNPAENKTTYYRQDSYRPNSGQVERLFSFAGSQFLEHVTAVKVRVLEQTLVDKQCQPEKRFEDVGTAFKKNERQWKWSAKGLPAGRYKFGAFSVPKWLPFLNFYIGRPKDTFTVNVGQGEICRDPDENPWREVDSTGTCPPPAVKADPTTPACLPGDCRRRPTAGTARDPHNQTFDGKRYSTMNLGEFVYVEEITPSGSLTNSFQVQVRQGWADRKRRWASVDRAVAVRAGGHIFQLHPPDTRKEKGRLLIDGEPVELKAGQYSLDEAVFRIKDKQLTVWAKMPHTPITESLREENGLRVDINIGYRHLDLFLSHPRGRYPPFRGMLGRPDGDRSNDFTDRAGQPVKGVRALANAWRITTITESIFTYGPGEGPHTFNLDQDQALPTHEQLVQGGHVAAATTLLRDTCKADVSRIATDFIDDVALDLMSGLTPQQLVDNGLCRDERVNPPPPRIGLQFKGKVTYTGVGLGQRRVTIRAVELAHKTLCETWTNAQGEYTCRKTDVAALYPPTLHLAYQVQGTTLLTATLTTPAAGSGSELTQDLELNPSAVNTNTVQYGQVVSGTIAKVGDIGIHTFIGQVGERIFIDLERGSLHYLDWGLYTPSGKELFKRDMYHSDYGPYTLQESGVYKIVVGGEANITETGTYKLKIWRVKDQLFTIKIGDAVSKDVPLVGAGHIETPGNKDTYEFSGQVGERIFIDLERGSLHYLDWGLYTPSGKELFKRDMYHSDYGPYTLQESGVYKIVVGDEWRNGETGTYKLKIWRVKDQLFTIKIGDAVSKDVPLVGAGHIETPGNKDTYEFSGQVGERIFIDLERGSLHYLDWGLYTPSGKELFKRDMYHSDYGPYTLQESGVYKIVVGDEWRNGETGTYKLKIWRVKDQLFTIKIGDTVSKDVPSVGAGHIETPGNKDTYEFSGQVGERIFIDLERGSLYSLDWGLYTPSGKKLFRHNVYYQNYGPYTLQESGVYKIVVGDEWRNGETGTYKFKLMAK